MNPYKFITTENYLNQSFDVALILDWLFEQGHTQTSAAKWLAEFCYPHHYAGNLRARIRPQNHPNYAWTNLIPKQYFLNPTMNG